METLILAGLLSTSLILLVAGVEHVIRQARLRSRLLMHRVLGPRGIGLASASLAGLEVLAGGGVLWSVVAPNRAGLIASLLLQTALYGSFGGYLYQVMRAGNTGVPCGCGPAELPVGGSAIARTIGLGALSGVSVIGVTTAGPASLVLHADASGLLAVAAGATLAILLVILPSTRRVEPVSGTQKMLKAVSS